MGHKKNLVFPGEGWLPLCSPGFQELLGFTRGLQSTLSAQGFSRSWSCVLGLFGGLWELLELCGGITRPCDYSGVLCALGFVLGLPAEVLIHVGLWNCSRALGGYGTGAVLEKAGQRKRRTPVKATGRTGTWLCVWMLGVQKRIRQQEPSLMSWKAVQIPTAVER